LTQFFVAPNVLHFGNLATGAKKSFPTSIFAVGLSLCFDKIRGLNGKVNEKTCIK
jgi:hypothetical protein